MTAKTDEIARQALRELDVAIEKGWARIKRGQFFEYVHKHGMNRRLYQLCMVQYHHFIRNNSYNQAVAAKGLRPDQRDFFSYVLRHASEELGHEDMIEHDLRSVDLWDQSLIDCAPLPPTQAYISYLYYACGEYGAVARLGYAHWAENVYPHLAPIMASAITILGLKKEQMTFFGEHANLDAGHSKEVEEQILLNVRDEKDIIRAVEVARTSLHLAGNIYEYLLQDYLAEQA